MSSPKPPGYAAVYQYRQKTSQTRPGHAQRAGHQGPGHHHRARKVKKARFVTITARATLALDQQLIASAKDRAGIKGYLTSLPVADCPGGPVPEGADPVDPVTVINAYHQLFEVERSFRMSKTDLRARPMLSHVRDSIEANLAMVLAALAVSRTIQQRTGLSIRRVVRTLRPLRSARISIGPQTLTVPPAIDPNTHAIIDAATGNDVTQPVEVRWRSDGHRSWLRSYPSDRTHASISFAAMGPSADDVAMLEHLA